MGRRLDPRITALTAPRSFWDWSVDFYARQGVEPALLALQDRHGLSVNMLLWCLWCGEHFMTPGDLIIKKAVDTAHWWSTAVTTPLREARRAFNAPPLRITPEAASALKAQIATSELAAEKIEQEALERLAAENLVAVMSAAGAKARARRTLAAYIRHTDAVKTAGFSVSLIENLIGLRFPSSESDSDFEG